MVGRRAKADAFTEIGDGGETGRRTRSQAAPEWTVKESLALVNEIAAVEVDCSRALSSYQKWKMVVENCKSMGLKRTLNQCKLRWSTMLSDYDKIKKWEMREMERERGEGGAVEEIELVSYWGLDREERKELGLPEGFDEELFEAVDKYLILQKKHAETDPESDPQAQADFLLDVITKLGPKKKRRLLMIRTRDLHQIGCSKEMPLEIKEEEEPQRHCEQKVQDMYIQVEEEVKKPMEEKPLEINVENGFQNHYRQEIGPACFKEEEPPILQANVQESHVEIRPLAEGIHFEGRLQGSGTTEKPKRGRKKKSVSPEEEKERAILEKLRTNTDMINAIVHGTLPATVDLGSGDMKNVNELHTHFIRCQGDALITCLGDIVNILNQFPDLFTSGV